MYLGNDNFPAYSWVHYPSIVDSATGIISNWSYRYLQSWQKDLLLLFLPPIPLPPLLLLFSSPIMLGVCDSQPPPPPILSSNILSDCLTRDSILLPAACYLECFPYWLKSIAFQVFSINNHARNSQGSLDRQNKFSCVWIKSKTWLFWKDAIDFGAKSSRGRASLSVPETELKGLNHYLCCFLMTF